MKKTLMTILGLLVGYSAYCADSTMMDKDNNPAPMVGEQGFALGGYYDEKVDDMVPVFHGFYKWFEAGVGMNWGDRKDAGSDTTWDATTLTAFAGFRYGIASQLYATAGASGYYCWVNKTGDVNPYMIGAYLGLEYFVTPNVMVNMQIMPYDYERKAVDARENEVFQEGMIGISYVF